MNYQIDPRMIGFQFTPEVSSINSIQSDTLNPTEFPRVRLRTNKRDQEFEWLAGDYTTRVAADTYNGRYIKKTSVSAASGAWVALPKVVSDVNPGLAGRFAQDTWYSQEFDVPVSTWVPDQDASPYIAAMINLENIDKPGYVQYSNGLFDLFGQLPERTYQCNIAGKRNGGFQDTIIRKRYTEFTTNRGIFAFKDVGVTLTDFSFTGADAVTGGSGLSFINDTADYGPGDTYLDRVLVSCGPRVRQSVYVDGSANVQPSPPDGGYRVIMAKDCQFFGADIAAGHFQSTKHFFFTNSFFVTSGGTIGSKAMRVIGQANNVADDFVISGIVSGDVEFTYAERGRIVSPQVGDVTGSNNTAVIWDGELMSGSVTATGVKVIRPV